MVQTSFGRFEWLDQTTQAENWPIVVFEPAHQSDDVLKAMYAILDFCYQRGWIHASIKIWNSRVYIAANFNDYKLGSAEDLLWEIADFVERRILAERIRTT